MKGVKIFDVFVICDEDFYRCMRRLVVNFYFIVNLMRFELLVVFIIEYFFFRFDEMFIDKGWGFNFLDWL